MPLNRSRVSRRIPRTLLTKGEPMIFTIAFGVALGLCTFGAYNAFVDLFFDWLGDVFYPKPRPRPEPPLTAVERDAIKRRLRFLRLRFSDKLGSRPKQNLVVSLVVFLVGLSFILSAMAP